MTTDEANPQYNWLYDGDRWVELESPTGNKFWVRSALVVRLTHRKDNAEHTHIHTADGAVFEVVGKPISLIRRLSGRLG